MRCWNCSIVLISLTFVASCSLPLPMQGQQNARHPQFERLRYEEDFSYLRDPSLASDPWDPVKYILLTASGGTYLSVGGEIRPFFEWFDSEEWGSLEGSDGYLLQRFMVHADLKAGKKFRFFSQFKSGLIGGRNGGPRPPDKDQLDIHQAFFDLRLAEGPQSGVRFRVGRQEMDFGSSRLISYREGPNVRRSFDGVRLTVESRDWTVDGFVTRPVQTKIGVFDDGPEPDRTFWGTYAVGPLLPGSGTNIDVYYLGLDRKQARFEEGLGREIRHSVGTRLWGDRGAANYNFEFVYQFGQFGEGDIGAWTIASETGYTLESLPAKPRLALRADITSGDQDPGDGNLGTFNPLFPKGAYFGLIAPIGPLNHRDLHALISLQPLPQVGIAADWLFFWRHSTKDARHRGRLADRPSCICYCQLLRLLRRKVLAGSSDG